MAALAEHEHLRMIRAIEKDVAEALAACHKSDLLDVRAYLDQLTIEARILFLRLEEVVLQNQTS